MLVIDGHNLIGSLPGWSLADLDDEQRLLDLLGRYARLRRKKIEVFFDKAAPGRAGRHSLGRVTAHFVQAGSTADEAIRVFLARSKRAARNFTVVTTDRQVAAEARSTGARVLTSAEFAAELLALPQGSPPADPAAAPPATAADEWYDLFGLDPDQAARPISMAPQPPLEPKRPEKPPKPRRHHGFPKKP
jgi:predicted RNA-binding protein with PIN domain